MDTAIDLSHSFEWDTSSLQKYDVSGPRYTSYPTANLFADEFGPSHYRQLAAQQLSSIAPLSLYVHVPFCRNICYYCGCNKTVTGKRSVARPFLQHLAQEVKLRGELHGRRPVTQLHLGGGTPTFLDAAELTELMYLLANHFNMVRNQSREYSIEIDPRTVTPETIALLKGLGFNRISMGIQDFDPLVQRAINRIQPFEQVRELTDSIRSHGFTSLGYDLIYGLPLQSVASYRDTLDKVIALNPDRIACYNYAHLPERFPSQRAIDRLQLPPAEEKLRIFDYIGQRLLEAGYEYIGMDHFIKPNDELALARVKGKLQRNFQGYSTSLASDLIGLGPSAISQFAGSFSQNAKDNEDYYARLQSGELPIVKGLLTSAEDRLRNSVIMALACQLELDFSQVNRDHGIDFKQHFAEELERLRPMAADNLVGIGERSLWITPKGRMLIRNICMVFDQYVGQPDNTTRFSRTI